MSGIFGLIGGMASAAASQYASMKNAEMQNIHNYNMVEHAAKIGYQYNEEAAKNADTRSRALYNDLLSPEAKVKQLRDAGLSVGLMYGQGGGSGASIPSGAQGGTSASPLAQTALPFNPELGLLAANITKTMAEAKNIQQDTENKETEKEKTTAEISQILAETKSEGLKQRGLELENIFKEINNSTASIENWITKETAENQVEKITIELDKAATEINKIIEETRKTSLEADAQQQIIDKIRDKYNLEMDKIRSEIVLNASKQTLTDAQATQAVEIAEQVAEETKFIPEYFKNDRKKANAYVQDVNNRLRAANISADAQITAAAIIAAGNVTNTGIKEIFDILKPQQGQKVMKWKPFKPTRIIM